MRAATVSLLLGLVAAALAATPAAHADTTSFSYISPPAPQTWTVPAHVHAATFDLYGAQGQTCAGCGASGADAAGGKGAHLTASIAVTPGDTLTIVVGGKGIYGGYNGGGRPSPSADGGRGGGATDVRTGAAALTDRVLV